MAVTIKETEAVPAAYPEVPHTYYGPLSEEAKDLDPDAVWARIEAYVRHRWTPREVIWIVESEGCSEWTPPLSPVVSFAAERWAGEAWEAVELTNGPMGVSLPDATTYRITAQVGEGDVPPIVFQAFTHLAECLAQVSNRWDDAGKLMATTNVGPVSVTSQNLAKWRAEALQHSGAGDLLRQFKRLK